MCVSVCVSVCVCVRRVLFICWRLVFDFASLVLGTWPSGFDFPTSSVSFLFDWITVDWINLIDSVHRVYSVCAYIATAAMATDRNWFLIEFISWLIQFDISVDISFLIRFVAASAILNWSPDFQFERIERPAGVRQLLGCGTFQGALVGFGNVELSSDGLRNPIELQHANEMQMKVIWRWLLFHPVNGSINWTD